MIDSKITIERHDEKGEIHPIFHRDHSRDLISKKEMIDSKITACHEPVEWIESHAERAGACAIFHRDHSRDLISKEEMIDWRSRLRVTMEEGNSTTIDYELRVNIQPRLSTTTTTYANH